MFNKGEGEDWISLWHITRVGTSSIYRPTCTVWSASRMKLQHSLVRLPWSTCTHARKEEDLLVSSRWFQYCVQEQVGKYHTAKTDAASFLTPGRSDVMKWILNRKAEFGRSLRMQYVTQDIVFASNFCRRPLCQPIWALPKSDWCPFRAMIMVSKLC